MAVKARILKRLNRVVNKIVACGGLHPEQRMDWMSDRETSGVAEPSRADEALTNALKNSLSLLDVRVLDHLIIAGGRSTSLAERGLL
jgi:DNA repair protein RadC